MRHRFLIVASVAALLPLAATGAAPLQNQQQVPDAPQPQKKPATKPAPDASSPASPANAPSANQPDGQDDNAFPEAVSRDAAAKAAEQDDSTTQAPAAKPSASQANPFPEDVSQDAAKAAAKAAGEEPAPPAVPKSDLPPGISSSQSQGSLEGEENEPHVADPARAAKDTEVGSFYLKTGNYQGALARFKDASTADATNVDAIFGLAEAQRLLGKTAEATQNYRLYLEILPNGPKARESMKALKTLQAKK